MTESIREQRGRLVRETWVTWAREQPDPKDSWLTPWEDLDEGQREVDMRIGEAVAAVPLLELLKRHRPVQGSWGRSCGTCWARGDSRPAWPCPEAVAIAEWLPGGEP